MVTRITASSKYTETCIAFLNVVLDTCETPLASFKDTPITFRGITYTLNGDNMVLGLTDQNGNDVPWRCADKDILIMYFEEYIPTHGALPLRDGAVYANRENDRRSIFSCKKCWTYAATAGVTAIVLSMIFDRN